jgi:hypothetical protein
MIESGLKGRLKEVAPVVPGQPGAAPVAGTVPPKPGQPAANPANVAMDMAAKKKQAQDAVKQIDAQIKSFMDYPFIAALRIGSDTPLVIQS